MARRWRRRERGGRTGEGAAGEAGLASPGDPALPDDLALPDGEAQVVVTDDGARLATTVIRPDGGRRLGRLRRRWRTAPVVLVHGWTNTRAVWAPVARGLLAAGHPVVAYDQRGHGASTFGSDAPTVERLGADLAAVLDRLDVRDAVLVGHSMGGFSVMAWAIGHDGELRDRARGLALVGTAAHGVGFGSLDRLVSRIVGGSALSWVLARPRLGLVLVRGAVGRQPRRRDLSVTREQFLATAPAVRAACYLLCTRMDLRAGLPSIDLPTVVLSGGRDAVTPARLGRTVADAIPDARFEVLPDAGHLLVLEETDRVVDAVLGLAGGAGGPGGPGATSGDPVDARRRADAVPIPTGADAT